MRTLTYTVTVDDTKVVSGITSFDEAVALTKELGGRMSAVMVKKEAPYVHKSKRVRLVAKAPVEK